MGLMGLMGLIGLIGLMGLMGYLLFNISTFQRFNLSSSALPSLHTPLCNGQARRLVVQSRV